MHTNVDVLGDEGRKALNACVKVKIYGKPENIQKYHSRNAVDRLRDCCSGRWCGDWCLSVCQYHDKFKSMYFMLPKHFNEEGLPDGERLYDIIDIHGALCKFDEEPFVEKYPIAETGSRADELRELIDKRRAAIERECKEAVDDPEGKRQYSWLVAQRRVRDCFAGNFAGDRVLLKFENGRVPNQPYSIFDIHDAVDFWDEALLLGMSQRTVYDDLTIYDDLHTGTKRWRNSDKEQREDVEREFSEAKFATESNMVKEYSQDEAKQRVKDKYPSFFTFFPTADKHIVLPLKYDHSGAASQSYNIFDIEEAIQHFEQTKCLQKYPDDEGPGTHELKKSVEEHSSSVKEEYRKAKSGLRRYSPDEAEQKVRDCFENSLKEEAVLFHANSKVRIQAIDQTYDIFDIHKVFLHFKGKVIQGPFNPELREAVTASRDAVTKEYQQAKTKLQGYSWHEAEHRVRNCFAGALEDDTDILLSKEKRSGVPKTQQTYDIFDIKKAVDHFDVKPCFNKQIYLANEEFSKNLNETADEARAQIEEEYAEAIKKVEIEYGSGFIIHDHLIITNKHVIEDVIDGAVFDKHKELYVSNSAIGELPCEVIHCDAGKDLALLYCPGLNLKQNRIFPLQLSTQPLLPGMPIFAFGFPMSHTGETALFVTGHVSGSKETLSGHTLTVLNCALNSGNSGGPILCWDKGQLKVVGVATQKHFKEILTVDEMKKIEKIRESLQTSIISSLSDDVIKYATFDRETSGPYHPRANPCQTAMFLLTLKLYDALETHSQFNLSNALPGYCVVEFIKECISKYSGVEGKEELAVVVKWSEDRVNILPSAE